MLESSSLHRFLEQHRQTPNTSSERTLLVGSGPAECSSSMALSVLPAVIWDVNGYYRDLGVRPTATRKDLRLAYHDRRGEESVRLTYVIKQLLNRETRREYDLSPLGEPFLDDYVRAELARIVKAKQQQVTDLIRNAGFEVTDEMAESIERDIAAEMGYMPAEEDESDTPDEVIDASSKLGKDDPHPAKFEYSHYVWGVRPSADPATTARLSEWQQHLVSALSRKGISIKFAVGLHGKAHRWVQATVGYRTVFLLSASEQPTEELAADVADAVQYDAEQRRQRTSKTLAPNQR